VQAPPAARGSAVCPPSVEGGDKEQKNAAQITEGSSEAPIACRRQRRGNPRLRQVARKRVPDGRASTAQHLRVMGRSAHTMRRNVNEGIARVVQLARQPGGVVTLRICSAGIAAPQIGVP